MEMLINKNNKSEFTIYTFNEWHKHSIKCDSLVTERLLIKKCQRSLATMSRHTIQPV